MTMMFGEILTKRLAARDRVLKAVYGPDEADLARLVKDAQTGSLSLSDTKAALRTIDAVLKDAGEKPTKTTKKKKGPKAMPTTSTKYTNKGEVLKEANRLAKELMAKDPSLSLAAARAKVWEQNPDLAQQYKDLPKGPEVKVAGAAKLRKGQSVIDKATQEAREIQKSNPGMSLAAARSQVWHTHPDLVEEYRRETR